MTNSVALIILSSLSGVRVVAHLDGLQVKVNALPALQSPSGDGLSALMTSILEKAFKGDL
jgi:hypothetical protein